MTLSVNKLIALGGGMIRG